MHKEHVLRMLEREHARVELELTAIGYLHIHNGTGFVGAPPDIRPEPEDLNEMGDFDVAQETNKALAITLLEQKKDLEQAIKNVAAGSYGVCETCGKNIELERLAATITAATCISCAQQE